MTGMRGVAGFVLFVCLLSCVRVPVALATDWAARMVEHDVAPQDTDPAIRKTDANNVAAYLPDTGESGRLLVFFGGAPSLRRSPTIPFLADALTRHYRVLMVDYTYNPPGVQLCSSGRDPCFEQYRYAKIFGGAPMPGLSIAPSEGLVSRTAAMLRYLAREWPAEHWDRYLENGQPRWGDMTVSGFSQGAGLAAFLATRIPVGRVVLLSSPWDHYQQTGSLAAWLSGPSATPGARWWGMYSAHEAQAPWMAKTYAALGLTPDHIRIVTDAAQCAPRPGVFMPNHWAVAELGCTPRDEAGRFLEQPLWDAVLGSGG